MTNMVYILGFVGGLFRQLFVQLDRVAFGFIDDSYGLIETFAKAELVSDDLVKTITINLYVVVGIFALFRMALLLVNSILDPDKLTEKGAGVTKVFFNFLLVFVFLIATPIVFNIGLDIQKKVVEENYMQRLFINVDKLDNQSAGENLRNIAIGSLLTIDDYVVDDGKTNENCNSECGDAVEAYNKMVKGEHTFGKKKNGESKKGFDFSLISKHIDADVEGDNGEDIFVYNYPIIISTVVGGFITYILLSFALDIAVRMIELAVLEILAPLFIITYIDPKSSKSGPFSKWLKTVGKTYASLFIKLGVLGIMFLLISVLSKAQANNNDLKGFAGLVLIIAILIFAKKAPKWLGGMFGVEGGIGGLSIGKKLKDEMLGGGALSKAAHKGANTLGGAAMGAGRMAWNNGKNRRAGKKEAREKLGYKRGLGKKAREARSDLYNKLQEEDKKYANMSKAKALREAKKTAYNKADLGGKTNAKQFGAALAAGAIVGGQAGLNAKDLKGSLKASMNAANQKATSLGFKDKGIGQRVSGYVKGLPGKIDSAWGDPVARQEAASNLEKNKMVEEWTKTSENKRALTISKGNFIEKDGEGNFVYRGDKNTLIGTQGALNKFVSNINDPEMIEKTGFEIKNKQDFLIAQHASLEGISLKDIDQESVVFDKNSGKLSYKLKGSDEVYNVDKNLGGHIDPTSSYGLTIDKLWNNYQNDCLSNYTSNQQAYAQEVGVYNNAISQIRSCQQDLSALNANAMVNINSALPQDFKFHNLNIVLNGDSSDAVIANINAARTSMQNGFSPKTKETQEYKNKMAELDKLEAMVEEMLKTSGVRDKQEEINNFMRQKITSEKYIKEIEEAQNSLQDIIDNIAGATTAEKAQKLSIESNKIASDLKAFEAKKAEKN